MTAPAPLRLSIAHTWDGQPLPMDQMVHVRLHAAGPDLLVEVDAPRHGDPPPAGPPGPTERLWEHEVVEVFFLGQDDRYLEVELGPHGHHLVLELHGERRVLRQGMDLDYTVGEGLWEGRWQGRARIPRAWLPPGPHRLNAYAIHGQGEARRYLAWVPPGGEAPDFHRLEVFEAVRLPQGG